MNGVVNSQFTPQSTIYLLKGLEIDAMNNTFWGVFKNEDEQFKFYMNNYDHIEFNEYTYQRKDGTVVVTGSYDDLRLYNYMIYRNGDTGNKSKYIYCFITSLGYLNDKATSITFETDVIQTWRFEIEKNFLPSYIAYEHRPQWYIDESIDDKRRPCINTQPENLEIGTDLVSSKQLNMTVTENISFAILVTTCNLAGTDTYTTGVAGAPSPLNYYVVPYSKFNGLDIPSVFIDDTEYNITGLSYLLDAFRKNEKLVNKCVSIYVNDVLSGVKIKKYRPHFNSNNYNVVKEGDFTAVRLMASTFNDMATKDDEHDTIYTLPYKLENFFSYTDNTKLYTYPFSYMLLSNNNGASKVFKNELWKDPHNIKFMCTGSPSSSKANFIPLDYKVTSEIERSSYTNLDNSFETSYELSLPVISDTTAMLMQSSRNSMNVGLSNIRRSNEAASAIASATGNAMTAQTNIQNSLNISTVQRNANLASNLTNLQNQTSFIQSGVNAVSNLATNLASGNIFGAIAGLGASGANFANTAIQAHANTQQTNMQNANTMANANASANASSQSTAISNALRNLTTSYQNQTNIQNAVDSYNAKIHDAQATADSIVSGSNDLIRTTGFDLTTPILYAYEPTEEYKEKINQIWNMRGYATNTIDYPNLFSKTSWNYIQTVKCNINGLNIDPSDLEKIKRVFDNGITLWHTKNIGDYSQVNPERYSANKCDKFGNYKEKKVH